MENHPIPQDITGFQFKLIGEMTIKQFAYLAMGVVAGWIFYITPLAPFIKIPLSVFFVGLGVSLAFLPFEGRPLDVMISNYIKALLNPTQFVYHKTGGHLWYFTPAKILQNISAGQNQKNPLSGQKLKDLLDSLPKKPKNKLDEKEMVFFKSLSLDGDASTIQNVPDAKLKNAPLPHLSAPKLFTTDSDDSNNEQQFRISDKNLNEVAQENSDTASAAEELDMRKEAMLLQKELETAKKLEQMQTGTAGYQEAHLKVLELQQLLSDTVLQKQELEKQLIELQKQISQKGSSQVYTPSMAVEKQQTQNVRSIPKGMGTGLGLPTTPEFPNIVTGIVKDPRENPLSNVLVEVKDGEGNAVRAFKTNALGQFASATPLTNGTYTIEFEDPKGENKFDKVEFSATGDIILPIEVISVDSREELRKSLFK